MNTTGKKILALDPATLTGYAHSSGHSGTWDLSEAGKDHGKRLVRLRSMLHYAAKMWGVELIAAEAAGFGSINPATAAFHNELRGVVRMVAAEIGAAWMEYHPTTIKAYATGSGRADKSQMIAACEKLLGIKPGDDNECDAIWILEMAKHAYRPKPSAKAKKSAFRKFVKKQPKLF